MSLSCTITQNVSTFYSTNLNSRIQAFNDLGVRISRQLGAPLVNVEIHQDQLYENISIAVEMFSKFAGYTEEYLVFDSDLYEDGKGVRLDTLFSLTPDFNFRHDIRNTSINSMYTIGNMVIGDTKNPLAFQVAEADPKGNLADQLSIMNSYDYLINTYRKVIDIRYFEEGSSDGVNTLFTIEQTLAQQTYFSYSMGNYGFDLISWYILKDWMKNREKLLAINRSIKFDERTQYLQMYPPPRTPGSGRRFYGVLNCYVERPVQQLIQEQWVQQYSLALTKIAVGHVRGKYTAVNLFGGGQLNYNDVLSQGLKEKEELEKRLYEGSAPGLGDASPVQMLVG
jgi:hypothetical protein